MALARRLNSLTVKNYRSLADVTVTFEDLTVLVGPNGGGKSNILDVLRFVRDALTHGLASALSAHGGIPSIRPIQQVGSPTPPDTTITLAFTLDGHDGTYSVVFGGPTFEVRQEHLVVGPAHYHIQEGRLLTSVPTIQYAGSQGNNLLLPLLADVAEFAPVRSFLTGFGLYTLLPDKALREPQRPAPPHPLNDNGDNLTSALRAMLATNPDVLTSELNAIVSDIVDAQALGVTAAGSSYEFVEVQHSNARTSLEQESDGTVRALALLVALYQQPWLSLISVEEPELFIHPPALSVIAESLQDVAERSQVLITTHSPDMMTHLAPHMLRWVYMDDGATRVRPIAEHNVAVIQKALFTTGDLLRIGALLDD